MEQFYLNSQKTDPIKTIQKGNGLIRVIGENGEITKEHEVDGKYDKKLDYALEYAPFDTEVFMYNVSFALNEFKK
jgi:hypothetical protein